MQLPIPINIGDSQSIELSSTEVPIGAKLQMVGWMIKNNKGNTTSNLKEVTLRVIDRQECQLFHQKNLTYYEFCTLPESPGNFCKVSHTYLMNLTELNKKNLYNYVIVFLIKNYKII